MLPITAEAIIQAGERKASDDRHTNYRYVVADVFQSWIFRSTVLCMYLAN